MAFDFNTFMGLVRQDNPSFKRVKRTSSIDPLIDELRDKKFFSAAIKDKIENIIAYIPYDKQQQYSRSLAYVGRELGVRIGAIPCNPVMKFVKFRVLSGQYTGYNTTGQSKLVTLIAGDRNSIGPRSLIHQHTITWSSSNGHTASLAQVRTREYVKFLADTQAEPFNKIQDPDREFYAPGNRGTTGATSGTDDHSTKLPALICCNPRKAGTLIAEQWYQYSVDNGATWKNIVGAAYLIEKTVRQAGTDWVYVFKKSHWPPHNMKPFHFEVEYLVGPAPEYMPRTDTDVVAAGFAQDDDITKYSRRFVYNG